MTPITRNNLKEKHVGKKLADRSSQKVLDDYTSAWKIWKGLCTCKKNVSKLLILCGKKNKIRYSWEKHSFAKKWSNLNECEKMVCLILIL